MSREEIKHWLQLPLLNFALATVGRKGGDLEAATSAVYDRVEEMLKQAHREGRSAGKQ